ncbi:unnamed protein product [Dibothriocephalus latus]|uniref:Uncharacterized protein n=1 Tax=Dibothriocephalus latus TaxID=60516 RepID=A0A3P7NUL1_DIBLA|nr:unnamed protein product [Dibothriocephalus latus]
MPPTLLYFATLTVVFKVSVDDRHGFLCFRQFVGGLCSLLDPSSAISVMFSLILLSSLRFQAVVSTELTMLSAISSSCRTPSMIYDISHEKERSKSLCVLINTTIPYYCISSS